MSAWLDTIQNEECKDLPRVCTKGKRSVCMAQSWAKKLTQRKQSKEICKKRFADQVIKNTWIRIPKKMKTRIKITWMRIPENRLSNNRLVNLWQKCSESRLLSITRNNNRRLLNKRASHNMSLEMNKSGLSSEEPLVMIYRDHENDDGDRVDDVIDNQPKQSSSIIRKNKQNSDPGKNDGLKRNEKIQVWLVQ